MQDDSSEDIALLEAARRATAERRDRELVDQAGSRHLIGVALREDAARGRAVKAGWPRPERSLDDLSFEKQRTLYYLRNPVADEAALRAQGRTSAEIEAELYPWRHDLRYRSALAAMG